MVEGGEPTATYLSFLMRLWRTDSGGFVWRASLEEVDPAGGRYHFADLDALFGFLIAVTRPPQTRSGPRAGSNDPDGET